MLRGLLRLDQSAHLLLFCPGSTRRRSVPAFRTTISAERDKRDEEGGCVPRLGGTVPLPLFSGRQPARRCQALVSKHVERKPVHVGKTSTSVKRVRACRQRGRASGFNLSAYPWAPIAGWPAKFLSTSFCAGDDRKDYDCVQRAALGGMVSAIAALTLTQYSPYCLRCIFVRTMLPQQEND